MIAATLTRLPLEAGGAVLTTTGRAVHSLVAWSFAHYMRAPLAHTGIAAMLTLSLMATSNALYFQHARHPAPLFGVAERPAGAIDPTIKPVVPAVRPKKVAAAPAVTPKAVLPKLQAAPKPARDEQRGVGNADVLAVQRKLESMKLFSGTVDGYYGPQTASAIRSFEGKFGLKPTGALTPEIIKTILAAPLVTPEPKPIPAPEPVPATDPVRRPEAMVTPSPQPVTAVVEAAPAATETRVLRRELPETPQEAMNIAADTAGDAIETIINGVQSLAMTTKPEKPAARAVPEPQPLIFEQPAEQAAPQVTAVAEPAVAPVAVAAAEIAVKPQDVPVLDTDAKIEELTQSKISDPVFIARVQRGLSSLGFLHGPIDGKPSDATARAIRAFETFYNYERTGRITAELPDLLVKAGATL